MAGTMGTKQDRIPLGAAEPSQEIETVVQIDWLRSLGRQQA